LIRSTWVTQLDVIQNRRVEHLLKAYHLATEFLIRQSFMFEIDLCSIALRALASIIKAQLTRCKQGYRGPLV
jgi:hypothetical protein